MYKSGQKGRMFAGIMAMGLVMAVCAPAWAVNPASWAFNFETSGGDVFWTSPTSVDPVFPQYDYTYSINSLDVRNFFGWSSVIGQIPPASRSGAGSVAGPPPADLANQSFVFPADGSTIAADVHIYVDAAGTGHVDVTNVNLGSILGIPLTGIRGTGVIDVTGRIPEPGSLVLLAFGSCALMLKRRGRPQCARA